MATAAEEPPGLQGHAASKMMMVISINNNHPNQIHPVRHRRGGFNAGRSGSGSCGQTCPSLPDRVCNINSHMLYKQTDLSHDAQESPVKCEKCEGNIEKLICPGPLVPFCPLGLPDVTYFPNMAGGERRSSVCIHNSPHDMNFPYLNSSLSLTSMNSSSSCTQRPARSVLHSKVCLHACS